MLLRRQAGLFRNGLLIFDVLLSALVFLTTFFARQSVARLAKLHPELLPTWLQGFDFPLVTQFRAYQLLFYAMPPIWAFALYVSQTTDFRATYKQITVRYARAVGIGLALFVSMAFLFKMHAFARSFVVLFGVTNIGVLVLGRYVVMETIAFMRHKRVDGHRMVIVGCNEQAVQFAQSLNAQRTLNIKVLGHVTVPAEQKQKGAEPVIGEIEHLDWILDGQPVDEVFFGVSDLKQEILGAALNMCDERGVDVLLPLPPTVPSRSRVEIANVDGYEAPLLGLRRTPSGEVRLALKRVIDIAGVLAMLLVALPILLVVSIAIKATSAGPILFRQVRAGRNGRKFTMFKFRSMCIDAEAKRDALQHLNEMSGPVFKIRKDPRVTKVGAFIRRTSLDELPQLFNILLGDMSLVGPRPPLPSEVGQYKPWQRRRLSVKPGLTGLWQVSGRNNIDFEEWMALDLRYIDNWSLWLDVKILLRTLPAVIFKVGAS
jgi:exopolysaccharide biosynthesis polyprenyl glycosylphosphotransferase